jgi:predicted type IV restriction endonuclease
MRQLAQINGNINELFLKPSDDLVKSLTKGVYMNQKVKVTSGILDQFRTLIIKAIDEYIDEKAEAKTNSRIAEERLKIEAAFKAQYLQPESPDQNTDSSGKIVTTQEELEAFYIVKGIVRQVVEAKRVSYKDSQTYFSIILDDSSHKTICRLYMNGKKKNLGTFDSGKNETKNEILSLDDIFKYSDALIETAKRLGQNTK